MIYFVLDNYEDFAISSYDRYSAVWFFTVSYVSGPPRSAAISG